eukprot:708829-Heterocapsa_arctica.AAC.1
MERHDPRLPSPYAHGLGRGIMRLIVALGAIQGLSQAGILPAGTKNTPSAYAVDWQWWELCCAGRK